MMTTSYDFIPIPNLPSDEDLIARCNELEFPQGFLVNDPSTHSPIAWVKCGVNTTLSEAHMQHWTVTALRDAGITDVQVAPVFRAFTTIIGWARVGFIAMQYIEGTDCTKRDVDVVAKAVEALISLRPPPDATLGHFGCGTSSIMHTFFLELTPHANYRNDQDFYDHIPRIFKALRIPFDGDLSTYERFLCPSDFNPRNFRKSTTPEGQPVVFAMDFGATCFMPLPFIEVALFKDRDNFRQGLIEKIKYPRGRPEDVAALLRASGWLVPFGVRPVALPPGVTSRINYG